VSQVAGSRVGGADGDTLEPRNLRLVRLSARAGAVVLLFAIAALWVASRLPDTYSLAAMGTPDFGGGRPPDARATGPGHGNGHRAAGAAPVSVSDLQSDPARPADAVVTLTATKERVLMPDGRPFDGYALNGQTPGPTIRVRQGDLLEVRVTNVNVADGMTLHWHGMRVPNGADGVAGVTQDAIAPGSTHTYRFVAEDAGTYWYHSHQVSHEQVRNGLLGAVVVTPRSQLRPGPDAVALIHTYAGVRTINGRPGPTAVPAEPGSVVRVRVINSDNGPMPVWVSGAPMRVLAIDGTDLHEPGPVTDSSVVLTAGARADLGVRVPERGGARVEVATASMVLGSPAGPMGASAAPSDHVDLLQYGTPTGIGFDPDTPDRRYDYIIGRRVGFLDGRPGMWWTVNGRMYPDVPMFMIRRGEVGRFTIRNDSGEVHPMHLHGHRMLVLSRDGVPATGSPWWVDSLNVEAGQTYETAFIADNPGIWMDHCHNLPHAAEGLVAHLMYEGVTSPFVVGGDAHNQPE
jgi:FtsP/CotA-like multicopper oxidase with cupredoxin domain